MGGILTAAISLAPLSPSYTHAHTHTVSMYGVHNQNRVLFQYKFVRGLTVRGQLSSSLTDTATMTSKL